MRPPVAIISINCERCNSVRCTSTQLVRHSCCKIRDRSRASSSSPRRRLRHVRRQRFAQRLDAIARQSLARLLAPASVAAAPGMLAVARRGPAPASAMLPSAAPSPAASSLPLVREHAQAGRVCTAESSLSRPAMSASRESRGSVVGVASSCIDLASRREFEVDPRRPMAAEPAAFWFARCGNCRLKSGLANRSAVASVRCWASC